MYVDKRRKDEWLPLAIAVMAMFAVGGRFIGLGRESLWYDEIVVAQIAQRPIVDILAGRAGDNGNPAGFFALANAWQRLVGQSEGALRILPAFFGLAGMLAFWGLARELVSKEAALVSTALLAVHPLHVHLSQEYRVYSLLFLLTVVVIWAAWRFWLNGRKSMLVAYAAAGVVGLYMHYYTGLVLVAVNSWLLLHDSTRRQKAWWIAAQFLVVLAFVPGFSLFFAQLATRGETVGSGHASRLHILASPLTLLVGRTLVWKDSPKILLSGFMVLCCFLWGVPLLRSWRANGRAWRLLLPLVILPWVVIVPMAFALDIDVFAPRRGIFLLPPLLVLLGHGLAAMPRRWGWVVGALIAGLMMVSTVRDHLIPTRDDWRGVARYVADASRPEDAMVFYPDIGQTSFQYYAELKDIGTHPGFRIMGVDQSAGALRGVATGTGERAAVRVFADDILRRGAGRIWLFLDQDALPAEQCRRVLRLFEGVTTRTSHRRFDRRLDVYLLREDSA